MKGGAGFLKALFVALFAVVVLRCAWVADDAYITFRTIDNFANGYGLTWNVGERVQAYTHPLWMILVSAVHFYTNEFFFTSIALSAVFSVLAVCVLVFGIARSLPSGLLAVAVLTFSKAFVDYSTSGLENSLTHLALVLFCFVFLGYETDARTVLLLSLLASLAVLNRMDAVLLFLPALTYSLLKFRRLKGLLWMTLGFSPFLAWEAFALLYYGFPFPNTAYAKLYTGLGRGELVGQGLYYLIDSINVDPLTLVATAIGLTVPFFIKDWRASSIAAGAMMSLVYVVSVGGDFMSGRFLAAPLLGGVVLLAICPFDASRAARHAKGRTTGASLSAGLSAIPALGVVALLGLAAPHPTVLSGADYGQDYWAQKVPIDRNGVSDERAFYYPVTGLLRAERDLPVPSPRQVWVAEAQRVREEGPRVVVKNSVGFFGFSAGPSVHVIDELGLGDAFLARLPPAWKYDWRIGHFFRVVPEGYQATVDSGQNRLADRNLAEYYNKLALITRGPLLERKRLVEILRMNLGHYEGLIDRDLYRHPGMLRVDASQVASAGAASHSVSLSGSGVQAAAMGAAEPSTFLLLPAAGIQIELRWMRHDPEIEVEIDHNHDYRVVYVARGQEIATSTIWGIPKQQAEIVVRRAKVPRGAVKRGYDAVRILPGAGGGDRKFIRIRLLESPGPPIES